MRNEKKRKKEVGEIEKDKYRKLKKKKLGTTEREK